MFIDNNVIELEEDDKDDEEEMRTGMDKTTNEEDTKGSAGLASCWLDCWGE